MTRHNTIGLFNRKRAVSPLIATVLLIAFAVALGAVVMNWGRGYVEDTANIARERSDTEVKCASDVDVSVVEIDNTAQVCYNTTLVGGNHTLYFIVENKKSTTIDKIQARLIGDKTRVPLIIDLGDNSNLSTNQAKFMNISYDGVNTYGTPQQLKLTPYIKVGGQGVSCPASGEVATSIKSCSVIWSS
jgi:flagellin-like protein